MHQMKKGRESVNTSPATCPTCLFVQRGWNRSILQPIQPLSLNVRRISYWNPTSKSPRL